MTSRILAILSNQYCLLEVVVYQNLIRLTYKIGSTFLIFFSLDKTLIEMFAQFD